MVDYSKWKDIEVSDDEDETHPNIDTPSLFRWRHQARVERMEEMKKEREHLDNKKNKYRMRKRECESRKMRGEDTTVLESTLKTEAEKLARDEVELEKKERLTPWNVDTIASDGFSKTVINEVKPSETKEESDEVKAERFRLFSLKHEKELKEFGMLRKYEDSRKYLQENPHLACEDTANYLVYWCIDLAIEEKFNLMDHVSHQCIAIQFLLELAKQLERDPRACISGFFSKIAHADHSEYRVAFNSELEQFRGRIRKRAEEKIADAMEKERQERLGPGGLDPLEVMESLPEARTAGLIGYPRTLRLQALQKCFESQDIPLLQKTIAEMPEEEATYHMKRCVDSGLWVPNAKDKEKAEQKAKEEKEKAEAKDDDPETPEKVNEVKEEAKESSKSGDSSPTK